MALRVDVYTRVYLASRKSLTVMDMMTIGYPGPITVFYGRAKTSVYIIVESLRALAFLLVEAFIATDILNVIPHLG